MSSKTDDLCTNLEIAIRHLRDGTEGLRKFAPVHANKVAQKTNEITTIFMEGVIESEISNGEQSPRPLSAQDRQGELNATAAVFTPKKAQAAALEATSSMTFADYETSSPKPYIESDFPVQRRVVPKYPPGLGFGPDNDPSAHGSDQQSVNSSSKDQMLIGTPAKGHEPLVQATALSGPVPRYYYSSKVAVPLLPFSTLREEPTALRLPAPNRGLNSSEHAAIIGYSEASGQEKESSTEPLPKAPEVTSAPKMLDSATSTSKVSWAKMAAVPSGGPKTINLRPQPPSVATRGKAPGKGVSAALRPDSTSATKEPQISQSRIVWLIGCPANMTLHDVSNGIHEGPLVSICIVDDFDPVRCPGRAACVMFKEAQDALSFYHSSNKMVFTNNRGRYVSDVRLELGLPYPADDNIRSMDAPTFARRRLTFVRSHLFAASNLTKARFQQDLEKHCSQSDNIELIHLYNSGNATVVFAGVHIAREVKEAFLAYSKQKGPYHGVQVTYSKDPCEHEMRLITIFKD